MPGKLAGDKNDTTWGREPKSRNSGSEFLHGVIKIPTIKVDYDIEVKLNSSKLKQS